MPRYVPSLGALALFCLVAAHPAAQTPADPYAAEAVVIERSTTDIVVAADGSEVRRFDVRLRVQSTAGVQQAGTVAYPYTKALGTVDFEYVRVRKAAGTVIETPTSSALEVPAEITRAAPTYTDLYFKHVNVQGLAVGDVLEYAVRSTTKSLIPGSFTFEHEFTPMIVSLADEVRVSIPAALTPNVKTRGQAPAITEANGRRQYIWRRSTSKRPTDAELERLAYDLRDRRPDIQITTFKSWADVGESIQKLWADRSAVTPAIREKAVELTRGTTTDEARVRALYAFVATKIRYVSVSMGLGRIQPHPATEGLANEFGDCKDKHTLLSALLKAIGVDARPALIGVEMGLDRDVPSMAPFNHVITAVALGNRHVWLDTTMEVAPFGHLSSAERGKDVLVIPLTGPATLEKTPAAPERADEVHTTIDGNVSETGRFEARVEEAFSGDSEVLVRTLFRALPTAQWPEIVKQTPTAQQVGGVVSDVTTSALEDTSEPFTLTYRIVKDTLPSWSSKQVSAVVPFALVTIPETPAPAAPLSLDAGRTVVVSRVKLPKGFTASLEAGTVPETKIDNEFSAFTHKASLVGDVLEVRIDHKSKVEELAVDQFPAFRMFARRVNALPESVTLRARTAWKFGDSTTIDWFGGASAATVEALRAAAGMGSKGDYRAAIRSVEGLLQQTPNLPAAVVMLAYLETQVGNRARGIDLLKSQLDSAPSPTAYKLLARYLWSAGARAESTEALARGRTAYPDDAEFALHLGESLVTLGRAAEAIPVLTSQLANEPDSARLQWNLGKAYISTKQNDLAVSALRQAASLDSTPFSLNNIAWALADAGLALDEALGYAERAVREVELTASQMTLPGLDNATLETMSQLAMYWDTLAWAHFRKGDLPTAERYLLPAWDLMQKGIYADHLGDVYAARRDSTSAALYYARALVSAPREPAAEAKLVRLMPATAERASLQAREQPALARERTRDLPRLADAKGTAEVFVLIGASGSVEDVRFISGSDSVRPVAELLRAIPALSRVPGSGGAKIVRRVAIGCVDGATCSAVLLTADVVTSVK